MFKDDSNKIIDYIVDLAVNKFVIDREYNEFVDLLKCYINSKEIKTSIVHLILILVVAVVFSIIIGDFADFIF